MLVIKIVGGILLSIVVVVALVIIPTIVKGRKTPKRPLWTPSVGDIVQYAFGTPSPGGYGKIINFSEFGVPIVQWADGTTTTEDAGLLNRI